MAYADRRALLLPEHSPRGSNVMLGPIIVVDGYVVGGWKRTLKKGSVVIEASPFTELGEAARRGLAATAARYGEFFGVPVVLS